MRVLIAGGGTGGHFYPALALIERLRREDPNVRVAYAGTSRGIEARVLPAYPYIRFFPIHGKGLVRGRRFGYVVACLHLFLGLLEALAVLARFRPDVVIGMGNYSSFAPVLVGAFLGKILPIRTLIHEQNAIPGLANRILARFVDAVLVSHPRTTASFPRARRVVVTGTPVREDFFRAKGSDAIYRRFGLDPDTRTVLVFGGSLGSKGLVEGILRAKEALGGGMQVLLVLGSAADEGEIRAKLERAGIANVVVRRYIDRMWEAFAIADLIVARAGATTIAEIAACGKPAVLVPWDGAADGHQRENARFLEEAGACTVVDEDVIVDGGLARLIRRLLNDERALNRLARNARRSGRHDADALIMGEIRLQ
ncbi:undecaprenyldiphospho-muramoylpentapeptide beta-N-acetylglucosaminyltransferase, partial [Candidatus Acetothermia bacterium]